MTSLQSINHRHFIQRLPGQLIQKAAPAATKSVPTESVQLSGNLPARLPQIPVQATQATAAPVKQTLPSVESVLKDIFGPNFSEADLLKTLSPAIDGALPIHTLQVANWALPDGKADYRLMVSSEWRDAQGDQVARNSLMWAQGNDGSLKLKWGDMYLEPEHRSQGFLETLAVSQIGLLREKSQHPESTLELGAGGSHRLGETQQEIVGKYLWAKLGLFEFSTAEIQEKMATSFNSWLREKAETNPVLTPAILDGLEASSKKWNRAEQYAEFDFPLLKLPIERHDGRSRTCSLGKAFLLDPKTSGWKGICKVNQIDPHVLDRAEGALALGGRALRQSPTTLPDKNVVEAALAKLASNPATDRNTRIQHLGSLAGLKNSASLSDFQQLLSDVGTGQQRQEAWSTFTEEQSPKNRMLLACYRLRDALAAETTQQLETQLGGKLSPDGVSRIRMQLFTQNNSDITPELIATAKQYIVAA